MDFVDQISAAVAASTTLSADAKTLVTDFLTTNHALLERVGPETVATFFSTLSAQGSQAAFEGLVNGLAEPDLLTLLSQEGPAIQTLIAARAQAMADYRTLAENLGKAALQVLVPLVLAAI